MKKITQNLRWLVTLLAMIVCTGAWAQETGTINFGNNGTKITSASVTGNDNKGNTWTITTAGTSSYTPNTNYSQVGSSSKPATSITFTTTLTDDVTITSFSAKFGGFTGTAGTVTLKVGNTTVGTGSLNAANDVTVSSTTSETGKVLTVTVTGIAKGVKCYNITYTYSSASGKQNSQIAWSASEVSATMGNNFNNAPTLSNPYNLPVTYNSSAETVATIGNNGAITLVGAGTTTISAVFVGDDTYDAKTVSYTLTVSKQNVTLSFSEESIDVDFDNLASFVKPTLTTNPEDLPVIYSSTDKNVATVNESTGDVTIVGIGTTTIIAKFAGNNTYNEKSASYDITVSKQPKMAQGYYELVTNASTLAEGNEIILVYVNGDTKVAMGQQTNNNRASSSIKAEIDAIWNSDNTLVYIKKNDVQALVLKGSSDDGWYFNTGNGYLYAASNSSNHLKTEAAPDDNGNAKATINISDGNATIKFMGTNSHNLLKYNSINNLFSCYSSGQNLVQIYRKVVVVEGTLAAGKYATRIYPFAPKKIEGVKFYTCTAVNGNALALTVIEEPAANTPYILGNETGAAIDITQMGVDIHQADTYKNNLLVGTFVNMDITSGYVLQTQNGKQSFYKVVDAINVPPYRAYLDYSAEIKALGFDDATAINTLEVLTSGAYEGIYTVDGVKLNHMEKGVNILKMADGTTRKVIVK